jgi:hypothetical protein
VEGQSQHGSIIGSHVVASLREAIFSLR